MNHINDFMARTKIWIRYEKKKIRKKKDLENHVIWKIEYENGFDIYRWVGKFDNLDIFMKMKKKKWWKWKMI